MDVRPVRVAEQQLVAVAGVGPLLLPALDMQPQRGERHRVERARPAARLRLGLTLRRLPVDHDARTLRHDRARLQVDVLAAQADSLTATRAGRRDQQIERVQPIVPDVRDERPKLVLSGS